MDTFSGILGIVLVLGAPAVVVGGITALIVRSAAGARGQSPADAGRKALKGFWIAVVVTVALEIILVGMCLAALDNAYGNTSWAP